MVTAVADRASIEPQWRVSRIAPVSATGTGNNTVAHRLVAVAGTAAVGYAVLTHLDDLALALVGAASSRGEKVSVILVVAAFLPLHVRHVWYAIHGRRAPAAGWTLLVMAVVLIASLPLTGPEGVRFWSALFASALIVLRRWHGVAAAATIGGFAFPAGALLGAPVDINESFVSGTTNAVLVIWRGLILFVAVWLAAALRELQDTRAALVRDAVALERRRIDEQLQSRLDAALAAVVDLGDRVTAHTWADPVQSGEVARIPDHARTALAEARTLIQDYRRPSLEADLHTAIGLLAAAGVEATTEPTPHLDPAAEVAARSGVRRVVSELLDASKSGSCALSVDAAGTVRAEMLDQTRPAGRAASS